MSPDRPLDALLPALTEPVIPKSAVHPRVLELETEGGTEWLILVWADPGGPRALHTEVQALVEATLLSELSRAPETVRAQGTRRFSGLRLLVYAPITWDIGPSVRAFGFQPHDVEPADDVLRTVEAEARRAGRTIDVAAGKQWRAVIQAQPGALGEKLDQIEQMMAERLHGERWGATPGGPSRLFASYVAKVFGEKVQPSLAGLDSLGMLLIQSDENVVRWLPPLVFQALCDFLPVVAASVYGAKISWAESEDLGDGFAHPPLIRVDDGGDGIHVPIGHHVLRWWMMPLFPGEDVPSLSAWLADQFG